MASGYLPEYGRPESRIILQLWGGDGSPVSESRSATGNLQDPEELWRGGHLDEEFH